MDKKDYYNILGVDKKANKEDIKKAFHKLAHKYHPDKKGGDPDRFKEISEAYSILSDEKKRAEYDSYGRVFGADGGGMGGFDFSNFTGAGFEDLNLNDIFSEFFGAQNRQRTERGRDIAIDLELSFGESVFGVQRKVLLTKSSLCSTCSGKGAKPGTTFSLCTRCNGKGKIHETRKSFFGSVSTTRVCDLCNGEGQMPKERCVTCHGIGVIRKEEEISISVPPGIDDGEVLRLSRMGEAVARGETGDLYVKIRVKRHAHFYKEGSNIITNLNIKLTEALLGSEYKLETLDGPLTVTIPEGVGLNETLRVKGKGVPIERGKRGDLLIKLNIALPNKLSKKARAIVEELRGEGI